MPFAKAGKTFNFKQKAPMRVFTVLLFLMLGTPLLCQVDTVVYQPANDTLLNPERGFYRYTETRASSPTPLTADFLEWVRSEGRTIIFRYFFLDAFLDAPISDGFLQQIEEDFAVMRESGVKVIARFAYTDHLPASPPYLDAPPLPQLLSHIDQLKPLIQENSDVLLTLQNGFWGVWGENYYSDVYGSVLDAPLTAQNWADRRAVTDSLLSVLPGNRLLSLRYPLLKAEFYGFDIPTDSLTAAEAYSGSIKSRTGYHNDCFLVAANDFTFGNTETEKPYWETESRYTIMGGESCGDNPIYTNCVNALTDLENAHWTYLNDYYHPDVLNRWAAEGCLPEIKRRLGYRLSLETGIYETIAAPGTDYHLTLDIRNEGFAAPVNPRPVELVFEGPVSTYRFELPVEIRRWYGGQSQQVEAVVALPESMETGTYKLYLHLPDVAPQLRDDARYAIQLANSGLWEAATGRHDLQMQVEVEPVSSLNLEQPASCFSVWNRPGAPLRVIGPAEGYDLRIIDMAGRTRLSQRGLAGVSEISLPGFPRGMYVVQLFCKSTGQWEVFKIVR